MSGYSEPCNVFHLQVDVGVNKVIAENASGFQETAILRQSTERLIKGERYALEFLFFLRWQIV